MTDEPQYLHVIYACGYLDLDGVFETREQAKQFISDTRTRLPRPFEWEDYVTYTQLRGRDITIQRVPFYSDGTQPRWLRRGSELAAGGQGYAVGGNGNVPDGFMGYSIGGGGAAPGSRFGPSIGFGGGSTR